MSFLNKNKDFIKGNMLGTALGMPFLGTVSKILGNKKRKSQQEKNARQAAFFNVLKFQIDHAKKKKLEASKGDQPADRSMTPHVAVGGTPTNAQLQSGYFDSDNVYHAPASK
jgi:hypothetical protein